MPYTKVYIYCIFNEKNYLNQFYISAVNYGYY